MNREPPSSAANTRFSQRVLLVAAAVSAGCAPEDLPSQGANAEVYAQVHCENLCAKFEECAPVPKPDDRCEVESCIDEFSAQEDNPCFPLAVETTRCLAERDTCDEFLDNRIDSTPGSACYDVIVVWTECESEHRDDS